MPLPSDKYFIKNPDFISQGFFSTLLEQDLNLRPSD